MKVKVRIAVAMDHTGRWYCYGEPDNTDEFKAEVARNLIGQHSAKVSFIEAEVEAPEPLLHDSQTIQATLVEEEKQ